MGKPTKAEQSHMDAVRALGCIVCMKDGYRDAAIHHTDGKTKPGAHLKVLPLCYEHHQGGADKGQFISRHPYKARFESAYGTEAELLARVADILEFPF
jgi:hypothetical protein